MNAKINQKSVAQVLKTHEKLLRSLFTLQRKSDAFRRLLNTTAEGNTLSDILRGSQRYVWVKVGLADHLYPVYSDHHKTESVAYVTEDTDFVKRNKKDTRFSWRVLGRAGTDNNGWCKTRKQAIENCEKYFYVEQHH